jgi:uncharacterized protein (TIGR03032 family)
MMLTSAPGPSPPENAGAPSQPPPLRSIHTNTFAQLLDRLGVCVAVTTYQAGKLVLLRAESTVGGPVVNTHFRGFRKPMGLAWEPGRFAMGTQAEIWEFHDLPAVAARLDAPDSLQRHDAAFLPRIMHFTGDIQVHEMAWATPTAPLGSARSERAELWFVNTAFSCLASRSNTYSFIPRWRPRFVSGLAPEDRCHLNGMCIRDGAPRYVTALGESDTARGWRENKRSGGVLIDVAENEVVVRGLSMPHSPRWHEGHLWVLESGNGGLGYIDPATGAYREICRLPGFTRGLDFIGPIALVGLSQVRESAIFSGISIAETAQADRCCGVWAVDTRSGQVVGFVRFTDAVQEVFAVQVLHGTRWPDVLSENAERQASSYELPDDALRQVPAELRSTTSPAR